MHPPFYIPDTRVSQDITHHYDSKPVIRRGAAKTILRFIPAPGWPPICPHLVDLVEDDRPNLPSGKSVHARPFLQVVPAPRNHVRDAVGRFLIRMGQRLILENRPG